MGEVIGFPSGTKGEVPVQEVLDGAKILQMVCIMGYDQDGNEYYASTVSYTHLTLPTILRV